MPTPHGWIISRIAAVTLMMDNTSCTSLVACC